MFGKKRAAKSPPAPSRRPSVSDSALLEIALDSLAALMRVLGRKSFDLDKEKAEDIERAFEGWARHVLLGTPPEPAMEADDVKPSAGSGRRDVRGLVRFVSGHRSKEHTYVTRSVSDLRSAIWTMIQSLRTGMTADEEADTLAADHLLRLAEAVDSNSPERLRQQANTCVQAIGDLVANREERHREQIKRLAAELSDLRSELDLAWDVASRDSLTGLANRVALDEYVERMADVAFLFSESVWFFMVDIDHFKQVNDQLGHQEGDRVLRQVASALVSCFPRKHDLVARYGGEEFAVVLQIDSPDAALVLTARALDAVRSLEVEHGDERLSVTVSMGAAELRPGESHTAWIERADQALYEAKQGGRDRAVISE